MSNQLRIAARKSITRSPGLIGCYPCFQAVAEGASLLDRSGAGNNAPFGAALTAANAWATANKLTIADNNSGTNAGGPFISAATIGLNLSTDSFLVCGMYNNATLTDRYVVGFGGIAGAANEPNGFFVRSVVTTGKAQLMSCYGAAGATGTHTLAAGGTAFGVTSTGIISNGTDHHVAMLYDGCGAIKRLWIYVDGVNDSANNGSGLDVTAVVNQMGLANGGASLGNLVFGGVPHISGNQQVWACTMGGWQVLRRAGSVPANIDRLIMRLAKNPTQPISSAEWP